MKGIWCILIAIVLFAGCRSQQIASSPVNDLPQDTMHEVREIVQASLDNRLPHHHGRFDNPIAKEVLDQLKTIPGHQDALTTMLKEQLDEELSARAEGMVGGDFPLMVHTCDIMGELGDPTFENSLKTLQEHTRLIRVHGAASRALNRMQQRERQSTKE